MTDTGVFSLMALKLARAAGYKVIITSSWDERLSKVHPAAIASLNQRTNTAWDLEVLQLNVWTRRGHPAVAVAKHQRHSQDRDCQSDWYLGRQYAKS
jgi:hypothetical protein